MKKKTCNKEEKKKDIKFNFIKEESFQLNLIKFFEINQLSEYGINQICKNIITMKKLKKFYKKLKNILLPNTYVINLLENPSNFFSNIKQDSKEIMKKYILYDDQYILLFQYFIEKIYNKKDKNNDIYIKNFSLFFDCFKEKLKTVNRNLETFLHITANYNNKQIFVDLFLKLNNMNLISSEFILIQNIFGETCLDIIFNHYFSNKKKISITKYILTYLKILKKIKIY